MRKVVPAVIPTSKRHLDTTLEKCADFADEVQVDIVDGVFAGEASWPYNQNIPLDTCIVDINFHEIPVELDLMIQNPEETLPLWIQTGAKKIVIHANSTQKLPDIVEDCAARAVHLGIALTNDTDLSVLESVDMQHVDYIQLMGIETIGLQGQSFDTRVLDRIREIKNLYPQTPISIDGSVNQQTIAKLAEAGADRFVSGSAILKSDNWGVIYDALVRIANEERL